MNSNTIGLRTAATVFGVVCLVQIVRLISRAEVVIAGHVLPLWPSGFAALVTGGLCVWLWRLGSASPRPTAAIALPPPSGTNHLAT